VLKNSKTFYRFHAPYYHVNKEIVFFKRFNVYDTLIMEKIYNIYVLHL